MEKITIHGELKVLQDKNGSPYLAFTIPYQEVSPINDFLKEKIPSEYFQELHDRNGSEDFHVTVLNVMEYGKLSKNEDFQEKIEKLLNEFQGKSLEMHVEGIGTAKDLKRDRQSWYIVPDSEEIQNIRENDFGLSRSDLHVTLAFKDHDVFGVSKGKETIVYSSEEIMNNIAENQTKNNNKWFVIEDDTFSYDQDEFCYINVYLYRVVHEDENKNLEEYLVVKTKYDDEFDLDVYELPSDEKFSKLFDTISKAAFNEQFLQNGDMSKFSANDFLSHLPRAYLDEKDKQDLIERISKENSDPDEIIEEIEKRIYEQRVKEKANQDAAKQAEAAEKAKQDAEKQAEAAENTNQNSAKQAAENAKKDMNNYGSTWPKTNQAFNNVDYSGFAIPKKGMNNYGSTWIKTNQAVNVDYSGLAIPKTGEVITNPSPSLNAMPYCNDVNISGLPDDFEAKTFVIAQVRRNGNIIFPQEFQPGDKLEGWVSGISINRKDDFVGDQPTISAVIKNMKTENLDDAMNHPYILAAKSGDAISFSSYSREGLYYELRNNTNPDDYDKIESIKQWATGQAKENRQNLAAVAEQPTLKKDDLDSNHLSGIAKELYLASISLHTPLQDKGDGLRMPFNQKVAENRANYLNDAARYSKEMDYHKKMADTLTGEDRDTHMSQVHSLAKEFLKSVDNGLDQSGIEGLVKRGIGPEELNNLKEKLNEWKMENMSILKSDELTEKVQDIENRMETFASNPMDRFSGLSQG